MGESWFYTVIMELTDAAKAHQPDDLRDTTLEACRKAMDEHAKEQAVIDAAEGYVNSGDVGEDIWPTALVNAVEAMQAARGK